VKEAIVGRRRGVEALSLLVHAVGIAHQRDDVPGVESNAVEERLEGSIGGGHIPEFFDKLK